MNKKMIKRLGEIDKRMKRLNGDICSCRDLDKKHALEAEWNALRKEQIGLEVFKGNWNKWGN